MEEEDEIVRAYNVQYTDNWLEVEDFRTIRAEDEEEAREIFEEEYAEEGRQDITEVEQAYELNKTKIEELLGGVES
jgi:hypothetical protein